MSTDLVRHPKPLSMSCFRLFQELIHKEAGIFLSDAKRELLVARLLRRLRALGLQDFRSYYRVVMEDRQELSRMLDRITTNETHFFRESNQLEVLRSHLAPRIRSQADSYGRRLRVWSAGCSTGEEPYSLAMILLDALPDWEITILAGDISTEVLEKARLGVWPLAKAEDIPELYLKRFMLKGIGRREGTMTVGPELRSVVRFDHLNLGEETWNLGTKFDLIFCRNVLIYFSPERRRRVVSSFLEHLRPHGFLFLGHAEGLSYQRQRVVPMGPNIYAKAGGMEGAR